MRGRQRWIVLAVVVLLGGFTARYVSLGPGGSHKFDLGSEVRDLPLISPTLLGWILPGDPIHIDSVQFSPDNRWMYVSALRGPADQLGSVTLSRPQDGVLVVEVRLVTFPGTGGTAIGIPFATPVFLDPPLWEGIPPITLDASTGRSVVVGSYRP